MYSTLDRAYTDEISSSDADKTVLTVASILQRLHQRLMPLLDTYHTSSLMYQPCCICLNQSKKPGNAPFSILDDEKTLQLCGIASRSGLEVAIRTRPSSEMHYIISWWLMLSPPFGPSSMNHMNGLHVALEIHHRNA